MGRDEAALRRLAGEARRDGAGRPVGQFDRQLGLATEHLNRPWYGRTTGQPVKDAQTWVRHPVLRSMAATLDGIVRAPARCSKPNLCCRGRSRRRWRRRSTWPNSSTICWSPMPPPRCSRLSPAAANGSNQDTSRFALSAPPFHGGEEILALRREWRAPRLFGVEPRELALRRCGSSI